MVFLDDHTDRADAYDASTAETFGYFVVWIAGFLVPFEVARWTWLWEFDTTGRLLTVAATVAVLDAVLIRAGVRGRGGTPIVQPWSWGRYGLWLGGRAFLLAIAVF